MQSKGLLQQYDPLIAEKKKKDWIELLLLRNCSQRKLAAAILLGTPWDLIIQASIEKKIIWISSCERHVILLNSGEGAFFLNRVKCNLT